MSAYDITEFLRTAYRPFAYCVPSKSPLNTAYQKGGGGVTLSNVKLTNWNPNNVDIGLFCKWPFSHLQSTSSRRDPSCYLHFGTIWWCAQRLSTGMVAACVDFVDRPHSQTSQKPFLRFFTGTTHAWQYIKTQ